MENMMFGWASGQTWWHYVATIVVIANGITMTLRIDMLRVFRYLEKSGQS